MPDRLDIIEKRMLLLVRAMRSEFSQAPIGEFEARWDVVDPATPLPPRREVKHLPCDCEICRRSQGDYELPVATHMALYPWHEMTVEFGPPAKGTPDA